MFINYFHNLNNFVLDHFLVLNIDEFEALGTFVGRFIPDGLNADKKFELPLCPC